MILESLKSAWWLVRPFVDLVIILGVSGVLGFLAGRRRS